MKVLRKIIEIDEERCTGCGNCVLDCQEGAIRIIDGKARVVSDTLCDGMGNCMGRCPADALRIVERESDPYELEAVAKHLQNGGKPHAGALGSMPKGPGGCASTIGTIPRLGAKNWPVKLRLASTVPIGANILLTADCAAQVAEAFATRYAQGKTLLTVCPKFEERPVLTAKLAEMFRQARPASVTSIRMEVPCCSGIGPMGREAVVLSGVNVPVREIILTRDGEELH